MDILILNGNGLIDRVVFELSSLEDCVYDLDEEFSRIFQFLHYLDEPFLMTRSSHKDMVEEHLNITRFFNSFIEKEIYVNTWTLIVEELLKNTKIMFGDDYLRVFKEFVFVTLSANDIVLKRLEE